MWLPHFTGEGEGDLLRASQLWLMRQGVCWHPVPKLTEACWGPWRACLTAPSSLSPPPTAQGATIPSRPRSVAAPRT